jgi:hypothetical protein
MQRPLPALLRGPLLCGLLLCRMAASQATLTVDATGTGGAFTTVQAAISAASPGDRIRVLGTGPYPSFLVDRAVDIQGAGGTRVPGIEVTAVPAGQSARIAGFALDLPSNASIFVHHCPGSVLLQNLTISGTIQPLAVVTNPGLHVLAADCVFTRDCTFFGRSGPTGSPAVLLDAGRLTITGGVAIGGATINQAPVPNVGLPGVVVQNGGQLHMVSADSLGGIWSSLPANSCDGGDGIRVIQGLVYAIDDCGLRGRIGIGLGTSGAAVRGSVRYTSDCVIQGAVVGGTQIEARPRLLSSAQVTIGTTLTVTIDGAPLQFLLVGVDLQCLHLPFPLLDGVLALTPTAALSGAILLDLNGVGTLSLPIPGVQTAANQNLFLQGVALGTTGHLLTGPTVVRTQ